MQICIQQPEQSTHAFGTSEELLLNATGGVAQVFRYWDRMRGARLMPAPSEIDFLDVQAWLAGVVMVEVSEGRELIYRVVGERAIRLRGYDPTGMTVAKAAFGRSVPHVLANYGMVIDRRIPLYSWNDAIDANGKQIVSGSLLLPLSSDGQRVDWVLGYVEDTAAYDWSWAR
jgi:hypothetical protein